MGAFKDRSTTRVKELPWEVRNLNSRELSETIEEINEAEIGAVRPSLRERAPGVVLPHETVPGLGEEDHCKELVPG